MNTDEKGDTNMASEQRLNYLAMRIEKVRRDVLQLIQDFPRLRAQADLVERNRQRRELGLPEV
jgi:hypothetical protein